MKIVLFKNKEKIQVTDADASHIGRELQLAGGQNPTVLIHRTEWGDPVLDENQNKIIRLLVNLDEIVCIYGDFNII